MLTRVHALAGLAAGAIILVFWVSTVVVELLGTPHQIAAVKTAILWGLLALIPALMATGGTGFRLGRGRRDAPVRRKKKRMPLIAGNGLLILVPAAVFLAWRAQDGRFDGAFYAVQGLELLAGAANLALIGLNARDGRRAAGRG